MKNIKAKNILKYIIKILMSIFIVLYIFVAPFTIFPKLNASQGYVNKQIEIEYMGILEMWNIDTFEGGSVSRTTYLEKRAIEFEKTHTGTFIMVQSMTPEQAKLNIQNGNMPDMVSFGIGVGSDLLEILQPFSKEFNVRDDLLNSGKFNQTQYAIPFLLGGYTIINETNSQFDNSQVLGCGLNGYNNGLIALAVNEINFQNTYENNSQLDTFDAYDKYLDKKFDCLLGTQRDMYRVVNRVEKGNMSPRSFYCLSGYTDLVQYVGITSQDATKKEISLQFIEHLLSEESQQKLASINMFSVNTSSLYQAGEFAQLEKALASPLKTLNVFLSNEKLEEIKSLSLSVIQGNSKDKNSLIKYLV